MFDVDEPSKQDMEENEVKIDQEKLQDDAARDEVDESESDNRDEADDNELDHPNDSDAESIESSRSMSDDALVMQIGQSFAEAMLFAFSIPEGPPEPPSLVDLSREVEPVPTQTDRRVHKASARKRRSSTGTTSQAWEDESAYGTRRSLRKDRLTVGSRRPSHASAYVPPRSSASVKNPFFDSLKLKKHRSPPKRDTSEWGDFGATLDNLSPSRGISTADHLQYSLQTPPTCLSVDRGEYQRRQSVEEEIRRRTTHAKIQEQKLWQLSQLRIPHENTVETPSKSNPTESVLTRDAIVSEVLFRDRSGSLSIARDGIVGESTDTMGKRHQLKGATIDLCVKFPLGPTNDTTANTDMDEVIVSSTKDESIESSVVIYPKLELDTSKTELAKGVRIKSPRRLSPMKSPSASRQINPNEALFSVGKPSNLSVIPEDRKASSSRLQGQVLSNAALDQSNDVNTLSLNQLGDSTTYAVTARSPISRKSMRQEHTKPKLVRTRTPALPNRVSRKSIAALRDPFEVSIDEEETALSPIDASIQTPSRLKQRYSRLSQSKYMREFPRPSDGAVRVYQDTSPQAFSQIMQTPQFIKGKR